MFFDWMLLTWNLLLIFPHFPLKNWTAVWSEQHAFFLWLLFCMYGNELANMCLSRHASTNVWVWERKGEQKREREWEGGQDGRGCEIIWLLTVLLSSLRLYHISIELLYDQATMLLKYYLFSAGSFGPEMAGMLCTHTHRGHKHFWFFWFQSFIFGLTGKKKIFIIFHISWYLSSRWMCDSVELVLFIIPFSFKFQTDWYDKVNVKVNLYMIHKICTNIIRKVFG